MFDYQYVLIVLLSAVIGYVTNYLAIKMLFHPYHKHRVFGKIPIPFTPGIIPKNRARIAKSIAAMMCDNILNEETIKQRLFNDSSFDEISNTVFNQSLRDLGTSSLSTYEYENRKQQIIDKLSDYVIGVIVQKELSKQIAKYMLSSLTEKMGFLLAMIGPIDEIIEEKITEFIKTKGHGYIAGLIKDVIAEKEELPLSSLLDNDGLKPIIVNALGSAVGVAVKQLQLVNLIEDELNRLDIKSFEKMILNVISRELHAITIFGALLGAILGLLNIVFIIM